MGLSILQKIAGGFLIGALLLVGTLWRIERHQRLKADAQVVKIAAAREADRRAYEDAQVKAAELNKAQVQRIETEQQRITANVEADLNARLERLRRELHSKPAAPQGVAGSPQTGGVSPPPAKPDEAPRLPVPPASNVCPQDTDDRTCGAILEEYLDQWINWAEQQLKVSR